MKKSWFISIFVVVLLFGCQQKQNEALDISKLEEVEQTGDVTEEQLKSIPIFYKAPTLKAGLEALPFEVTLPKDLPFDAMPFKMTIEDFKHDGTELRVDFNSISKKEDDHIILIISVHNFKVEYAESLGEEVQITDSMAGYYNGTLTFEKDGLYYSIGYSNPNKSPEHIKEDTIDLAEQML